MHTMCKHSPLKDLFEETCRNILAQFREVDSLLARSTSLNFIGESETMV
jgi:hypothetical protein